MNGSIDSNSFLLKVERTPMRIILFAFAALFLAGSLTGCCCRHAPEITDRSAGHDEEAIG